MDKMRTQLIDAHCHTDKQQRLVTYLKKEQILSCFNCQNKVEADQLLPLAKQTKTIWLSAGIHPWEANRYQLIDLLPILEQVSVVGEIGMDSVWTSVPLSQQQRMFEQQLAYASDKGKPVILHTKGQEKKISRLIKKYPNRYLVHWYSSLEGLTDFIEQDCYFTIGPSLNVDPAVLQVAEQVPINRLLLESDGLAAMEWVLETKVDEQVYEHHQMSQMVTLAKIKKLSVNQLTEQLRGNFLRFFPGN
ncbi:TatD family hydrolase [Vagococcus humatus]|uniref:Hydrolase TatD n=1 Tax=Vagococcus humatus TaxID=1889241 RepID=A0A3S0AYG1_9ENTE|nr:TatD family hydrolase [Vagococcus humatus]RST90015.1 hydrolase TatD [Vagococcus humatus]